ncbi:tnf receptor-associated factor 2, partial [Plakobranchus ocellatus]
MDVQADAALEAMAETVSGAEGFTGGAGLSLASSSSSAATLNFPSPQRSASLPAAFGGAAMQKKENELPQGGYPKEITVKLVEEKFLCGYCERILRDPLQSECGHRFCSCCRTEMSKLPQPVICQACIKEEIPEGFSILKLEAMFVDKAAIREMSKIPSKCINPGCTWSGIFSDYISKHENSCDKKMMACSLCGILLSQNKLANHVNVECPKRPITCQHCHLQMVQEQEEKHRVICSLLPVKCDKCSTPVPRNELQNHQEKDCIHREFICPVPDCCKKMSKDQFQTHLNESPKVAQKHLVFLFDKINQLEQELAHINLPAPLPNERGMEAAGDGATPRYQNETSSAGSQSDAQQKTANDAIVGAEGGADSGHQAKATLQLHEDLMSVLHGEIMRCIKQTEALTTTRTRETRTLRDIENKLEVLGRTIGTMELRLQEIQASVPTEFGKLIECGDGVATWCIPDFSQRRRAAVNRSMDFIESPPFTTGTMGYKLRMRLFPDGEGNAKGNALSVFLQLLPGPADDLLLWPFQAD